MQREGTLYDEPHMLRDGDNGIEGRCALQGNNGETVTHRQIKILKSTFKIPSVKLIILKKR